MTVNPAINLFGGNFGTNVRYILNIDRNGDNKADLAYVARFGRVDGRRPVPRAGLPDHEVHRQPTPAASTGGTHRRLGSSQRKGKAKTPTTACRAWAGVRSDPFFFDLTGFIGTTTLLTTGTAVGGDALGQQPDRLLRQPQHQRDRAVDPELASSRTPSASGRRRQY